MLCRYISWRSGLKKSEHVVVEDGAKLGMPGIEEQPCQRLGMIQTVSETES